MARNARARRGSPAGIVVVRLVAALSVAALAATALAGCGASATPAPSATPRAPAAAAPTPAPTPTPTFAAAVLEATSGPSTATGETGSLTETFPYGSFADPTTIDNEFFPLVPGTQWVWQGEAGVGDERRPHRVVTTVTSLTKVVDGVRALVVVDEDYVSEVLTELEIAFFAQDDGGTVWHLGQYPEEYENGEVVDAPTWIAGLEDARAGISMKATPAFSAASYSQGWGPAVGWTDRARVLEMDSRTCVPAGCYTDVLVIDEFNRDEPDAHQLKYYAPGVGVVRVGWAGFLESTQEVLGLVRTVTLAPDELSAVEARALSLEAHAYEVSPNVYAKTAPMEPG